MAETQPTRRKLGRGLDVLLTKPTSPQPHQIKPETVPEGAAPAQSVTEIPLDALSASPYQPRRAFDQGELTALADSIRANGILQPVVVRPTGAGRYELIAGERRWRAARLAGLSAVPAVVKEVDDETAAGLAIIENLQRTDLNPIERAFALKSLQDRFGLTQQQIAERIGMDRSSVANLIRLTALEPSILEMVGTEELSAGHARALLALPAGPLREEAARRCVKERWSVRRAEAFAKSPSAEDEGAIGSVREEAAKSADLLRLEEQLSAQLATKVTVQPTGRGDRGRIVISFYNLDHFDGLLARLGVRVDVD